MTATEQSRLLNEGRPAYARPLSEFAVRKRVSVDPKKFPNEEFDLLSIPAYDTGAPEKLRGSEIGSSKIVVEPGDVLISRIIPHIQRVWVVPQRSDRRQIASGEWIIFRGKDISSDFLRQMLLAKPFHNQFMQTVAGMGGSLLRARQRDVEQIEIPVPSIEEQGRIAAILNKADAIRRKWEHAMRLSDDLLQSTFFEMFGDPVENERQWPSGLIGDCLKGVVGGWSANSNARPATSSEIGVLKISAVTSGEYIPTENKFVSSIPLDKKLIIPQVGDLLFSRANTRELVAATCVVMEAPQNVFLPDKLWRLDVDQTVAEPAFLKCVMSHPEFRQILCSRATGTSGSMLNISKAKLIGHPIPIPPIELQRDFAALWRRVKALSAKGKKEATEADNLFGSLSQRAFLGEL